MRDKNCMCVFLGLRSCYAANNCRLFMSGKYVRPWFVMYSTEYRTRASASKRYAIRWALHAKLLASDQTFIVPRPGLSIRVERRCSVCQSADDSGDSLDATDRLTPLVPTRSHVSDQRWKCNVRYGQYLCPGTLEMVLGAVHARATVRRPVLSPQVAQLLGGH
jgi:hypothetical protein